MTQLKSLAHPDWPYAGTAHEWRGFVKRRQTMIAVREDDGSIGIRRLEDAPAVYQKQNFGPELP